MALGNYKSGMLFLSSPLKTLFKEYVTVMKKAFAVLVVVACALPAMIAAQNAADPAKMLQIFSAPIKTDGGTFQVVILNDRTVDPLFGTSPAKAAIRTKARMTTIFFVQGTAGKDFDFNSDVTVTQKGETITGKSSNMKNFVTGKVPKGEKVQGMVEMEKKVDLYEPFKFNMNGQSTEFRLNEDDVRDFGNR
jgi:hypothetical protein